MKRTIAAALLAPAVLLSANAHASCGSAFCTVNTDWGAQGLWNEPGTRFGLRFEYVDQDRLQAGTRRVAVGEIAKDHDEVRTLNRNWLATADHAFDERWSLSLALPFSDRSHQHLDNDTGTPVPESWNFREVGDLRVLARYRASPSRLGINLGLKLPTGRRDVQNADGEVAERSLQPGTGTTDLLLGAFAQGEWPASKLAWFVQGLAQSALDKRDEFKPGPRLAFDAGVRYDAGSGLGLLLQVNLLLRGRDNGAQAEPDDSGGHSLWASPGVTVAFGRDWQAYAFVQRALYQYVNGVQLVARQGVALGVTGRF
jgi:hypothetical protein